MEIIIAIWGLVLAGAAMNVAVALIEENEYNKEVNFE